MLFFNFHNAYVTDKLYMAIDCLSDKKSENAVRYYVQIQKQVEQSTEEPIFQDA